MYEALLGRSIDPIYDRLLRWLRGSAVASREGQVTRQQELPNGLFIVCEEWPSRAAYLEFSRCRMTLEAMLYTEEGGD